MLGIIGYYLLGSAKHYPCSQLLAILETEIFELISMSTSQAIATDTARLIPWSTHLKWRHRHIDIFKL